MECRDTSFAGRSRWRSWWGTIGYAEEVCCCLSPAIIRHLLLLPLASIFNLSSSTPASPPVVPITGRAFLRYYFPRYFRRELSAAALPAAGGAVGAAGLIVCAGGIQRNINSYVQPFIAVLLRSRSDIVMEYKF